MASPARVEIYPALTLGERLATWRPRTTGRKAGQPHNLGGDVMAMKRNCPKPNCIRVADGSYCREHNAEHDKKRGTKAARGYGYGFKAQRREYAKQHMTQALTCWRCGEQIPIGEPFHLGHDDDDRTIIRGPEHPLCNLEAAGKASHRFE